MIKRNIIFLPNIEVYQKLHQIYYLLVIFFHFNFFVGCLDLFLGPIYFNPQLYFFVYHIIHDLEFNFLIFRIRMKFEPFILRDFLYFIQDFHCFLLNHFYLKQQFWIKVYFL